MAESESWRHFDHLCDSADLSLNLPVARVTKVAKATTDTELTGINMAATMGDRFPDLIKSAEGYSEPSQIHHGIGDIFF